MSTCQRLAWVNMIVFPPAGWLNNPPDVIGLVMFPVLVLRLNFFFI
ncbi:hypothetical protein M096_4634 [Parabacteroides distasonis str. 3999B T(B) 6]|nr:hypothetical protein M095_3463 [Parabacteroides distasonis str. 3999B T(B) 4]KDS65634.1 hypothetical protein M096_4634 [Parabacteroides distasonis str. 3999B T(B) 6]